MSIQRVELVGAALDAECLPAGHPVAGTLEQTLGVDIVYVSHLPEADYAKLDKTLMLNPYHGHISTRLRWMGERALLGGKV